MALEGRELRCAIDEEVFIRPATGIVMRTHGHLVEVVDDNDETAEALLSEFDDRLSDHVIRRIEQIARVRLQYLSNLKAGIGTAADLSRYAPQGGLQIKAFKVNLSGQEISQSLDPVLEIARLEFDVLLLIQLHRQLTDQRNQDIGEIDVVRVDLLCDIEIHHEIR